MCSCRRYQVFEAERMRLPQRRSARLNDYEVMDASLRLLKAFPAKNRLMLPQGGALSPSP